MPFPIVSRRRFLSASAASAVLPVAASASAAATPLAAGGTGDRTGDVQAAIDALGPRGGTVVVPEGARFNLQALRFTPRVNLEYRIDDDRSANMPFPKRATNERVYFAANSSWPEQDTGATANEWRFTAPFHPGLTVDVRKDLAGADAWLAPGQSRTQPVRAGFYLQDTEANRWRAVYENYGDRYDPMSGVRIHTIRCRVELRGVGASAWQRPPQPFARIVGEQSGAVGFVREVAPDSLVLEWFDGQFRPGERVRDETARASSLRAVANVQIDENENAGISLDLWNGAVSIGGGHAGVATEALQTSGNLKLVPSRSSSVSKVRDVAKPTLVFGGNPEADNPHQLGIQYDPGAKTDATRRLIAVPADLEEWRGEYCPVSAMVAFGADRRIGDNAVNVERIERAGAGRWRIGFAHPLRSEAWVSADPSIGGAASRGWTAKVVERGRSGCTIEAYRPDGEPADLPAGLWLSMLILGGDV